jgi:hypothetical protein
MLKKYSWIGLIVVWLILRNLFHRYSNVIDLSTLVAAGVFVLILSYVEVKRLKNNGGQ